MPAKLARRCGTRAFLIALAVWLSGSARVAAEPQQGALRFSLDTDMFTAAGLHLEDSGVESEVTAIGFGPNHLSSFRGLGFPMPLTGLGLSYALRARWLLGLRTGLGFDVYDPDDGGEKVRTFGVSLMPGITFTPIGRDVRLFLQATPIFQSQRSEVGDARTTLLAGGFGAGIGVFIFAASSVSFDLGFHFESRFGRIEGDILDVDLRDLRGLIRLGLSLWR